MIAAADFPRTAAGRTLLDRLAQLGVPLADITADSRARTRSSPMTVSCCRSRCSSAMRSRSESRSSRARPRWK